MRLKQTALLLGLGIAFGAGSAEPLFRDVDTTRPEARIPAVAFPATYSTELNDKLEQSRNFFPLGILGDDFFRVVPQIGMNFTELQHACYEFYQGKPCSADWEKGRNGLFFFNVWAAHSLSGSHPKKYGPIRHSQADDGTYHKRTAINLFDPRTRQYVLDCAENTARHFSGKFPNIFMWGIDNELEPPLDYSPEARAAFVKYLKKAYKNDLAVLNKAWNANYTDFNQAQPPAIAGLQRNPGGWLDWRDFQEEAFADYLADYFAAIRRGDPRKRPVISKSTQCSLEMPHPMRNRMVNHERLAALGRTYGQGWYGIDQYGHGDRNAYEINYFFNALRPVDPADHGVRGVFSAESNNHAGPGWQFAQTYWRLLGNGLRGINFFVIGNFGGERDYATFSLTHPDGTRRDRFFYLPRFTAAIHRREAFWSRAFPAENIPRIAILVPQRDTTLAADTGRSWWDYSINDRLSVYSHLRGLGYWVETIPYGKLAPEFLNRFDALFLINAEHLKASEAENIAGFVKNGGVLFADMRSGGFDEHHIPSDRLEPVLGVRYQGVYTGIEVSPDDLWYNTPHGNLVRADGKILVGLTTARLVNREDAIRNFKAGWITENRYGKGRAYYYNTRLGALRPESAGNEVVREWFGEQLARAGLKPASRHSAACNGELRVELPQVDPDGNAALIVSGSTYRSIPAGELAVTLPAGLKFAHAFYAPAETAGLRKVDFRRDGAETIFRLPEIRSAGILYLFAGGAPLPGMELSGASGANAEDPHTPELIPGESLKATVQLAAPADFAGGKLTLQAYPGWKIEPASIEVPALKGGAITAYTFTVTTPADSRFFRFDRPYPVVAALTGGDGKRLATVNAVHTLRLDRTRHLWLLTDNPYRTEKEYPEFAIRTGATYTYPAGAEVQDDLEKSTVTEFKGKLTRPGNVRFFEREAAPCFDLGKEYIVKRLRLRHGRNPRPDSWELQAGTDGATFRTIASGRPEWTGDRWAEIDLVPVKARFIRVLLRYPDGKGGYLDEIELYGSEPPLRK